MSQTFLEDIPEFLEIQRNSFLRVLDSGLIQALEKINPIVSTSQSECGLLFYPKEYVLVLPENTITEAFLQGKTYGCKIYVPAIIYEKAKKNISNSINLKSWSCSALGSFGASEILVQNPESHGPYSAQAWQSKGLFSRGENPISGDGLAEPEEPQHDPLGKKWDKFQTIEKQKKVNPQLKALTKTLGSTLWPVISANPWPRAWPVSYKGFKTKDIKNNLFQGLETKSLTKGYGALVGTKGKAAKGVKWCQVVSKGPTLTSVERASRVGSATQAQQAKGSMTKPYFSSLFISIGCDALLGYGLAKQAKGVKQASTGTKKSLWVKNNGTWVLGTGGLKPSTFYESVNGTKFRQYYSPNKNQNHLIVLSHKSTRNQKDQVLLAVKGSTKTTIKNHGYFTFGLSFFSFGHFLRNLMCNSTLSKPVKTNTPKANLRFFSKKGRIQQEMFSNQKNNQIPFGLSQSSAYLNKNTNFESQVSLPSSYSLGGNFVVEHPSLDSFSGKAFSAPVLCLVAPKAPSSTASKAWRRSLHQELRGPLETRKGQATNTKSLSSRAQALDKGHNNPIDQEEVQNVVRGPQAHSLQLLRSFEHRCEKSHTLLQLKDFLKCTNKHFLESSREVKNTKTLIRYNILARKEYGKQITKNNSVTSSAKWPLIGGPKKCLSDKAKKDQHKEQVILKNTIITGEKKINPLSRKEWVCIGVLPLMTPRGHFIINGSHRIVVSQMGRAPGLYYQTGDKLQATIVPAKGAWLRMSVKENDSGEIKVWVRITPQRKIPYKIFLETYKYLENFKNPENPQFKFLNLTYKAINSKIKHFDKHYALGVISGQIQRTLLNFASYNLGTLGRKRLNERLSIKEKKGYLTSKDISLIKRSLLKNLGQNPTAYFDDDIDHLQNRRVRTCGELLQSEIEVGMARLKKTASKQLEDYANSNLSIIEKGSFQLKPKPLASKPFGSQRALGKNSIHSNDIGNHLLNRNDTALYKPHRDKKKPVELSYPAAKDFNHKINKESTNSREITQTIKSKTLAQKPIPFLVSVKSLRQSCTSWSFKQSSLISPSVLSASLSRGASALLMLRKKHNTVLRGHASWRLWRHQEGTVQCFLRTVSKTNKKGYQSQHYYGPWVKPLAIPGSYLDCGHASQERKANKNYSGQSSFGAKGLKPLFLVAPKSPSRSFSGAPVATDTKTKSLNLALQSTTTSPPTTLNLEKSKQKKWSPYKVISTKAFAGALREFFGSNPLSQYMDQTNPLAEITHKRRLSSLGPGGVDRASAGIAIRGIHPSHYGRICPIETPEGKNAGLVNSMTMWARVNEDGFLETPYLKVKGGSMMSHTNTLSPDWYFVPTKKETRAFSDLHLSNVSSTYSKAHPLSILKFGNDLGSENYKHQKVNVLQNGAEKGREATTSKTIKIVTSDLNISESSFLPNISIPTRDGAERSFERAKRTVVDFCGVSPTQNISVATSLIPFLEHDDATRALMGSNMQRQAVPLLKPQGPLVRTGLEGKVVGESGHALQATCSGVISIATRTLISIETFQTKTWSDQNFGLKESYSFLPQTCINANKSLLFLKKKSNHKGGNTLGLNFGTMPPLLCTSSWAHYGGKIDNLGGCDLTPKVPILNFFETLRWKGFRLSAFKIKTTGKEKQKKLQTTFYNYTFGLKEFTYETALVNTSPRPNNQMPLVDSAGWAYLVAAKAPTSTALSSYTSGLTWPFLMPLAPLNFYALLGEGHASQEWDKASKGLSASPAYVAQQAKGTKQHKTDALGAMPPKSSWRNSRQALLNRGAPPFGALAINFSRITELINQYNFTPVNKNPNFSTSISHNPLWLQKDGHAKVKTTKKFGFNTVYTYQKKNSTFCDGSWFSTWSQNHQVGLLQKDHRILSTKHKDFCPTNVTPLLDSQGLLCHNMSKKWSRKNSLVERKTKTQKLQEYARSNQATICVQRPAVKAGDWVQKGDLIGDCSASVNGVLSLGKNIVVAYLPMEGFNFEDAIVVSDRLVHEELYTSIHVQRVEFDMDAYVKKYIPKKIKIKKQKNYKTTGQDWITKHNPHLLQAEKELLNPLGIIKVGSWVGPGDVLVSKVVPVDRKIAPSRHLLLAVFQEKRTKTLDTDDTSLRVPKGIHGRVINVKVVGNGTVIPLDRNRFSLKKTISIKREKSLPFFSSGNKAQVGSLMGSKEPFWPLAKFALALPLAQMRQGLGKFVSTKANFSAQQQGFHGPNHNKLQRYEASKKPSAEQDLLKHKTFSVPLRQLKPKVSSATISKALLHQDLLTGFPNITQDLKKKYTVGILNILHQLKKRANELDVSIERHSRAFAVAKKVSFFPGFGGSINQNLTGLKLQFKTSPKFLLEGGKDCDLCGDGLGPKASAQDIVSKPVLCIASKAQDFSGQDLVGKGRASWRQRRHQEWDKTRGAFGTKKYNQAKTNNLTDTSSINLNFTKSDNGYLEQTESLNKPTILERKQIDGEYKIIQVRIYIAERKKLQVGDKMSGRHGNKGIVSTILPREDMPFLPDGTSVDMVLNPLGIPSRMNVGQVFECLLGLASSVCGEIIGHTPFDEMYGAEASRSLVYLFLYLARLRSRTDWLFQPNFPGKTIVFDGRTGLPFEQWVTVGRAYMLKLIHMVDEKIHARSIGPRSLVTQQPVKGRARGGGQRLGEMELWALEGFGAAYTLQEILTLKSDDIRGRENVENSIIFSTTAKAHIPETFRMMLFELRCLCLNVELN